jgi:lipopolysaccharide/colanic/teichoic acid biosynthesis glycosyltransferase/glycosyltransferase involved in cell wall biosynthesis
MEGHRQENEEYAVRILMLTQWFDPEPTFKGLEFARKLVECGHDVEVLTGFPNYPRGQLYPGYRLRLCQRESVDEISIVRVPLYPSHDRSAWRRALNYLSFAIAATVLGPALVRRPDVIYAYHPPGTIGLPALALGRWFSAPVVYDVQDLWPDTILSTGMLSGGRGALWARLPILLLGRFCRFVYRHADRVVVLSPGFRRTLIERGVAADKVEVIYNWAPPQQPAEAGSHVPDGKFTVVFAGNMGLAQGLDAVLEAAARCAVTASTVRFRFLGAGVDVDRLKRRAGEMRLANVEFLGWQPLAGTQAILNAADALLVHLKDDPLFAITIPSKTQAYLAAGRPIVMAVRGDAADLVARAGAGVLAEPGNPESIAEAIRRLAEMPAAERARMGQSGREFYESRLAFGRAVEKFDAVFRGAPALLQPPPVAEEPPVKHTFYACHGKRILDLAVALPALVVLSPLLVFAALLVRRGSPGPILFAQKRLGGNGRLFTLYKFRTMTHKHRIPTGEVWPTDAEVTAAGRLLRRWKMDELPQLLSVLKGEMSIVGPRPGLPNATPSAGPEAFRLLVRPGLTGLAQVNGNIYLSWPERYCYDAEYAARVSFAFDLGIICKTLAVLALGEARFVRRPSGAPRFVEASPSPNIGRDF